MSAERNGGRGSSEPGYFGKAMSDNQNNYPIRCHPAHPPPLEHWNQPVVLMVTAGLRKPNGYHCFDNHSFHESVLKAWDRAQEWRIGYYMIMPDHLHFFCVPGRHERVSIGDWSRKWKSFVTTGLARPDWRWLPGCWDTQMRGLDHYVEKLGYVQMNPVRKGLADAPETWKYQGEVARIEW